MQHNGVGRRGHLVGQGEQGVGATDGRGPQGDPGIEPGAVSHAPQVPPDDHQGNEVAATVDGHSIPGDHLDAHPAQAVQHGGQKHQHRPAVRPLLFRQKNTPCPTGTEGVKDAVPPLFADLSRGSASGSFSKNSARAIGRTRPPLLSPQGGRFRGLL